jgi:hypothetical protein
VCRVPKLMILVQNMTEIGQEDEGSFEDIQGNMDGHYQAIVPFFS